MCVPFPTEHLHDPSQPLSAAELVSGGNDLAPHQGRNAFNSERPLGVTPVPEGGVAIGGQPNLPEGHANMGDKIVGKTQKVLGKYTHNPDLHERGELRETGGKAAAEGRARAAHD
ncbi:hypothetical protein J3R82DRAFT_9042 [Butyriboletus roseoflavus]|nr:hypothetical protein J3R82DRAFT_9042 [Butyriboletus roseoflavus]